METDNKALIDIIKDFKKRALDNTPSHLKKEVEKYLNALNSMPSLELHNLMKQMALEHYQRMIDFAAKQDPDDNMYQFSLTKNLGENFFSDYCIFCNFYDAVDLVDREYELYSSCDLCPLCTSTEIYSCCDGLWNRMVFSRTWGVFVLRAKEVMEYIKKAEPKGVDR